MGLSLTIESLAQAIEREENVNPSYNNPGAITSNGSLITFPTLQAGQTALQNQLQTDVSGASKYYSPNETLEQFEETYTGGDLNAGKNVSSFLGIPSTTPIGSFANPASSATSATLPASSSTTNTSPSTRPFWTYLPGFEELYNFFTGTSSAPSSRNIVVDGVTIAVGIVLLTGAVFGFKNVSNTVIEGVKTGAKAGRDAAAVASL